MFVYRPVAVIFATNSTDAIFRGEMSGGSGGRRGGLIKIQFLDGKISGQGTEPWYNSVRHFPRFSRQDQFTDLSFVSRAAERHQQQETFLYPRLKPEMQGG